MPEIAAGTILRAAYRVFRIVLFPGVWFAFLGIDCATNPFAGLGPLVALLVGITTYVLLGFGNALVRFVGKAPKSACSHHSRVVKNVALALVISFASLKMPEIVNTLRDPLATNLPSCVKSFHAAPNGDGEVAMLGHADCDGWEPYAIDAIFVHKTNDANSVGSLAYRYYPSTTMDGPTVRWNGAHDLTIGLKLTNDAEDITDQKKIVDGVRIHYDIRLGCSASSQVTVPNRKAEVASLRTTSCAEGKEGAFYYLYSLFVHGPRQRDASSNLVFQYEPTVRGAEFDPPRIHWASVRALSVAVKAQDIARISKRQTAIDGDQIVYEFGTLRR